MQGVRLRQLRQGQEQGLSSSPSGSKLSVRRRPRRRLPPAVEEETGDSYRNTKTQDETLLRQTRKC